MDNCRARPTRYNERMENEVLPKITVDQLAGMMANGFAEMREQFEKVDAHFEAVDRQT